MGRFPKADPVVTVVIAIQIVLIIAALCVIFWPF
jgi:hypothetical protein